MMSIIIVYSMAFASRVIISATHGVDRKNLKSYAPARKEEAKLKFKNGTQKSARKIKKLISKLYCTDDGATMRYSQVEVGSLEEKRKSSSSLGVDDHDRTMTMMSPV
jgi:hypothetical protein